MVARYIFVTNMSIIWADFWAGARKEISLAS